MAAGPIVVYDPHQGTKVPFTPHDPAQVNVYVCGMTVYDHCHLGHARSAVAFDAIRSHLQRRYGVEHVRFARNITDVDDKILARAAQNGEPIDALTARMIASMHEDLAALGCAPPDHEPRATQHIGSMVALIDRLLAQGAAYVTEEGEVLFSAARAPRFGQVSGQKVEHLIAGSRVATDARKRDPMDFVLWKPQKPGEDAWDAPWGRGRPGWHLECSAMIHDLYGPQVDLHGGGEDLKFPHHECECAQSETVHGVPLARHWLHNGFVLANGARMGKSMGNFTTIKGTLETFSGEAVRLWILAAHYRQPLDFSVKALQSAQARVERLYKLRAQAEQVLGEDGLAAAALAEPPAAVLDAMDDDFDTPRALAAGETFARAFRQAPDAGTATAFLAAFGALGLLRQPSEAFELAVPGRSGAVPAAVQALVEQRQAARAAKDWATADAVRQRLSAQGWVLEDGPDGVRVTPKREVPVDPTRGDGETMAPNAASPATGRARFRP